MAGDMRRVGTTLGRGCRLGVNRSREFRRPFRVRHSFAVAHAPTAEPTCARASGVRLKSVVRGVRLALIRGVSGITHASREGCRWT